MFSNVLPSLTSLAFATLALSHPLMSSRDATSKVQVRQVLELPKPSWLENIAARPNGELLASRLDVAELYLVNPSTGKYSVIASFPGVKSVFGITEYKPDVYAVITGNFSISGGASSTPGTWSVHTVDLSKGLDSKGKASPKLLSKIPEANNLNGLAFAAPNTLYTSDSFGFKLYEIDVRTGSHKVAIDSDPLFTAGPELPLGINGIHWSEREQTLFFANSYQSIIGTLSRRRDGSFAPAQKLAGNPLPASGYDDLTLDAADNIYTATNVGNTVNFVSRDGKQQFVIAGNKNSTELAGATSVAFGRTPADKSTLYVVTAGGEAAPINGTITTGAKIVAIKLDK